MAGLGSWTPDLPPHGHDGLVTARNVLPMEGGYEPAQGPAAFTASVGSTWLGGGWFSHNGNSALLAGAAGGLYLLSASASTNKYAGAYTLPWTFAQFGDQVIGVSGGTAPIKYTISSATGAVLGGSPPSASMVAIWRDFVALAGDPSNTSTVTWSAINNAEGWTIGTAQCDEQLIPDGGPISGIAGGEFGVVFQQDAINVFEYVGAPIVWQRRKVQDSAIGALCQGGIGRFNSQYFFLHRTGFYTFDGMNPPTAIGQGRIDKTFFANYSLDEIKNHLRCAVDPNAKRVIWTMPGKEWVYSWAVDGWSEVSIPGLVGVTTGATASTTLEDIAVLYPSIEDVPVSLDDPSWQGGDPVLLAAFTDNILYSFSGAALEAVFGLPRIEMFPGREAIIRNSFVVGDMPAVTVSLDTRRTLADAPTNTISMDRRGNGDVPIRASGRYIQPTITVPAATSWTFAQGFDLEATPGGRL